MPVWAPPQDWDLEAEVSSEQLYPAVSDCNSTVCLENGFDQRFSAWLVGYLMKYYLSTEVLVFVVCNVNIIFRLNTILLNSVDIKIFLNGI